MNADKLEIRKLKKAIRAKCLECMCGIEKDCKFKDCALYGVSFKRQAKHMNN